MSFEKAGNPADRTVCWSHYATSCSSLYSSISSLRFWFLLEFLSIRLFTLSSKLYLAFLLCVYRLLFIIPSLFCISQRSPLCLTHIILPGFCCYSAPLLGVNCLSQKSLWSTCYWDAALCCPHWPLSITAGNLPGSHAFMQDSIPKQSQVLVCYFICETEIPKYELVVQERSAFFTMWWHQTAWS